MLEGKVAVVTGGTRGIGYATVKKFLDNGAKVILFGSKKESVDKALEELKAINSSYEVDGLWPCLSDFNSVLDSFEQIINKYMINEILFTGAYSSMLCVLFLKLPIIKELYRFNIDSIYLMTAFFGLFIFIGIFNSFNARTVRLNILSNIFKNKMFMIL